MPLSLFDDFKRTGFHSSVLTTFSVDPAFYDASVQYRLRAMGCQNNILLADAAMLTQAIDQMPDAFINAGRKYLIVPVAVGGAYHPKIALRYGTSKARLNIGSANVTSAGWGSNQEVVSALSWSNALDNRDNDIQLTLIAKAHDWLMKRMSETKDSDLLYKLDLLEAQSSWLKNAPLPIGIQSFSNGTQIDLLISDRAAPTGLSDQFISAVEGEVERLVIISPYWDKDLTALSRLHTAFGGPKTHIFVSTGSEVERRQSTFPVEKWNLKPAPIFHPMGSSDEHRFLHAKLIMAQTEHYDYLIYGSANCTVAALGISQKPGTNTEAVIYRRLPRGTIEHQLELDFGVELQSSDIPSPVREENENSKPVQFDPGKIERRDRQLIWSCPDDIPAHGSSFHVGDERVQTQFVQGRRPFIYIDDELIAATIITRIELADGRISKPVIVADPEMLMASAPNPLASSLKRKLDAVLNGDSDLINLARDIHLIFDDDGDTPREAAMRTVRRRSTSTSVSAGRDYDSPEAFRQALNLKSDISSGAFAHSDNPALQMILKIVLQGIIDLENSDSIDEAEARNAAELALGEDQDDEGDTERQSHTKAGEADPARDDHTAITVKDFERNQASLMKAVGAFESHIQTLKTSDAPVDLSFVTRALFIIYLMLYGCTKKYSFEEGSTDVLIPFSGIGTDQQRDGFLLQAARIVKGIWGPHFKDSLMGRVQIYQEYTVLPVPILTLVVLSRWILAAILSEARKERKAKGLQGILEKEVPKLFVSTSAFAVIDADQIATVIKRMEMNIGMEKLQADAIRTVLGEIEGSL